MMPCRWATSAAESVRTSSFFRPSQQQGRIARGAAPLGADAGSGSSCAVRTGEDDAAAPPSPRLGQGLAAALGMPRLPRMRSAPNAYARRGEEVGGTGPAANRAVPLAESCR